MVGMMTIERKYILHVFVNIFQNISRVVVGMMIIESKYILYNREKVYIYIYQIYIFENIFQNITWIVDVGGYDDN